MRFSLSFSLVGALVVIPQTLAFPSAFTQGGPLEASSVLKAINIRDFEHSAGVRRRSEERLSDLNLQTQSQLIYGRPGTQDQFILANMTLYAPDGLQIVMMERFEPLTSKVDCNGDDGTMSLTFKSQSTFEHALKTWKFINQSKEKRFLLIANHAGCGPDDERQPYIISNIREDKTKLTTFLTARPAPWSEVAGTYDIEFGKALSAKSEKQRRGFIGDIGNGLENIGQTIGNGIEEGVDALKGGAQDVANQFAKLGDAEIDKTVTFSVAVGQPNNVTHLIATAPLKLDCVNCFVTGSFKLTGHLSVKDFKLQELTIDASPQGLAATLELGATITAKESPESLQYSKELFSAPIPEAGIVLPGIFKLGAFISYNVGFSTTIAGTAEFQFGLSAGLPDTAKVMANINTPDQSSATGFVPSFNPLFDVQSLSASVSVAAFTLPKLSFGIELTKIGKFDVNVNVKLPEVSASLTAGFNQNGLCSHEVGASKTGVNLTSDITVEVDLDVDASIGPTKAPAFTKKLFGKTKPLFSKCFPLNIPGLSHVGASSVVPQPSTVPLPSGSVAPSSVVQLSSIPSATPIPPVTASIPIASVPSTFSQLTSKVLPSTLLSSISRPSATPILSGTGHIPLSYLTGSGPAPTGYGSGYGTAYGTGPTGTGYAAPSGTAPSYAPYPTHGNATRHAHYMRRALAKHHVAL